MSDINKIGVVGAGQMGRGIAQVAAFTGFEVYLFDVSQEALDFGLEFIKKQLALLIALIKQYSCALFITKMHGFIAIVKH